MKKTVAEEKQRITQIIESLEKPTYHELQIRLEELMYDYAKFHEGQERGNSLFKIDSERQLELIRQLVDYFFHDALKKIKDKK